MIAYNENDHSFEIQQQRIEEAKERTYRQEKDLWYGDSQNEDNCTCVDYLGINNIMSNLNEDEKKINKTYYKIYTQDKQGNEYEYNYFAHSKEEALNIYNSSLRYGYRKVNSIQLCELTKDDVKNIVQFTKEWNAHCDWLHPKG